MRRILFQWRGITVWSYPAMLYVGLVAGTIAGNAAAHVAGIDAFRAYIATLVLIPAALVGSKLLYVAARWRHYRHNLRRIWARDDGGAAMYGGFFLAFPLSVPLLKALDLPFGVFWDVSMFTIFVGMIFARIGCLLNGCCAGRASRAWGCLNLPNHIGIWEKRVPTQCLEAVWAAILAVSAMIVWPHLPFPGALFLLFAAAYAAGRLPLESAREAEPASGKFRLHHALSALIVVASLTALTIRWSHG